MHLGADTVYELLRAVRALDKGNHSLDLGIVGVEIEVVDVEFSGAISVTSSLECNANEGLGVGCQQYGYSSTIMKTYFTENVEEDRGTERTIFVQDFTVNG